MNVLYAGITNAGDRDYNEDSYLTKEINGAYCFIVADGLGGHGKGEVASGLVCEVVEQVLRDNQKADELACMFETAQEKLLQKQIEEHATDAMKTTMNILTMDEKRIYWGHIGDTRTYYFKKNKIVSYTKDHSVPQMMVSMGEIKEKDIRHHEDRNRLLRVMGVEWSRPDYTVEEPIAIDKKQVFLMCTDGFWEYIEEKEMMKCLKKSATPQEWLDKMAEIVVKNGTDYDMDNYTAVAVWINC